jgi:hypothetical protein
MSVFRAYSLGGIAGGARARASRAPVYHGEWVGSRKHGKGKYVCRNGDVLTGTWINDKIHEAVQCAFVNGDTLIGEFENDLPVKTATVTMRRSGKTLTFPWPHSKRLHPVNRVHVAHARALTIGMLRPILFQKGNSSLPYLFFSIERRAQKRNLPLQPEPGIFCNFS